MKQTISLFPKEMDYKNFEPYGYLWDISEKPKTHRLLTPAKFECDGRTTVATIWQPNEGGCFSFMERHSAVSQGFVQLSGSQSIVCVASPTDLSDRLAIPDAKDVEAFLINPGIGFAFKRGTWHSLNRYILKGEGASFLIFNSDPNPTEMIDFLTGKGKIYKNLGGKNEVEEFQHHGQFGMTFEIYI